MSKNPRFEDYCESFENKKVGIFIKSYVNALILINILYYILIFQNINVPKISIYEFKRPHIDATKFYFIENYADKYNYYLNWCLFTSLIGVIIYFFIATLFKSEILTVKIKGLIIDFTLIFSMLCLAVFPIDFTDISKHNIFTTSIVGSTVSVLIMLLVILASFVHHYLLGIMRDNKNRID